MKREQRECRDCTTETNSTTEHIILGFIPRDVFESNPQDYWVKASICESCGSLHFYEITEDDVEWGEERFLSALVESGHMESEEAKEILGFN